MSQKLKGRKEEPALICLLHFPPLQLQNVYCSCPLWREQPTSQLSRACFFLARHWESPVERSSGFLLLRTPLQRWRATMMDNGPPAQCVKVQGHNTWSIIPSLWFWAHNDWSEFWSQKFMVAVVVCRNEREYYVRRWEVWRSKQIVLGDTVEYSCIANYKSSDGSNLAKCTREGWKPNPLCKGIVNILFTSFSCRN